MPGLYAGLDVSDRLTAVCIVDAAGNTIAQAVVATEPEEVHQALKPFRRSLKLVGQESGSKAFWLHQELSRLKLPMICLDARHAHAALASRINKTDVNDAQGLAILLARGIYTTSFIKSEEAFRIKTVLKMRKQLLRKSVDLQNAVRMNGKLFGEMPKRRRRDKATGAECSMNDALASVSRCSELLSSEVKAMNSVVMRLAVEHPVCVRLMTVPGVGPICALNYVSAIDDPFRFESSRMVAAYFGLTPRVYQSGEVSRSGGISHRGDSSVRSALYDSARVLLRTNRKDSQLRRWGLRVAEAKGSKLAYVACARKLAVLMHHLWVTGQDFDPAK